MSGHGAGTTLEDPQVNIKLKIAGLWTASMFLFIYVDYLGLFIPGVLEKMIEGEVAHTGIEVSQLFLLGVIILMMVSALMIPASLMLSARRNRWTNIIVGSLEIIVLLTGTIGETWIYYLFATAVEIALIATIVWLAWHWPEQELATQ
ncbi:MAG: hypothetical protein HOH95_06675 [Dehalococcoidia bacterium]|nr:hypothetical protein [Dehalococcoidia bacterium]